MTGDTVCVTVDDREARCGVLEALQRHADCTVQVKRLRLGDYVIDGRLVCERKTLPDLVESIIDGRFLGQASRLVSNPLRPVILLEGTARDIAQCDMSREAIQGALIAASVMFGIPLLRSRDPEESARLMLIAARQARASVTGALPRFGFRPKSKKALQLYILQGLPNVGPVRARRLLERFETVEGVVAASPDDLSMVDGVGQTIARKIRWSVSEPEAKYSI